MRKRGYQQSNPRLSLGSPNGVAGQGFLPTQGTKNHCSAGNARTERISEAWERDCWWLKIPWE